MFFRCYSVVFTLFSKCEEVEDDLVKDSPRHQKRERVPKERREEPLERVRRSLLIVPASPYVLEYPLQRLFHPAKCRRLSVICRAVFSPCGSVSLFRRVHIPQKIESPPDALI